ncbi:MAG: TRAP transporter permease, partial [Deltaproteobacteria bacterium]|nr:TRAP transporter permease [Deltaproteobacteria bacterium]
MDPILTGIAGFVCILVFAAFGVPIGIALGTTAVAGLWLAVGPKMALITLKTLPYALSASYDLVVVPMFILMGMVASSTGVVSDLYDLMNRWLSRFRGSLLMVCT